MQKIPRLKPKNRTVEQLGAESLAAALCHADPGRSPADQANDQASDDQAGDDQAGDDRNKKDQEQ
jgi:hypothetical protein